MRARACQSCTRTQIGDGSYLRSLRYSPTGILLKEINSGRFGFESEPKTATVGGRRAQHDCSNRTISTKTLVPIENSK